MTSETLGPVASVRLDDRRSVQYDGPVDIRIGIKNSAREIELQLPDETERAEVRQMVEDALSDSDRVLWLTDKKGREVAVPVSRITYVELGSPEDHRRMGFSG